MNTDPRGDKLSTGSPLIPTVLLLPCRGEGNGATWAGLAGGMLFTRRPGAQASTRHPDPKP